MAAWRQKTTVVVQMTQFGGGSGDGEERTESIYVSSPTIRTGGTC